MKMNNLAMDVDLVNVTHSQLQEVERKCSSAFYLLDTEKLRDNYLRFEKAFKDQVQNCQIAYSLKTNYTPLVCKELLDLGCWAEVVSEMEYEIAKSRVGFDPTKTIVNGPLHEYHFIERALLDGALLNVDSWYILEFVEHVCSKYPDRKFTIGVRLNYPIVGGGLSRFGIESSRQNLRRLFEWQVSIENCSIAGFHSHFSNSSRSLASFDSRMSGLLKASQTFFGNDLPQFINVGGGFLGEMPYHLAQQFDHTPDFDAYARRVASKLTQYYPDIDELKLYIEPGTAIVSNAMWFVCKVYDVKSIDGQVLAVVNGSNHNINHKWQGESLPVVLVKANNSEFDSNETFDVVGNTCIEKDVLRTDVKGHVEVGDYLVFQYMGAYTNVLKQPFIHPSQAIYAWDGEKLIQAKREETESDVLASYA